MGVSDLEIARSARLRPIGGDVLTMPGLPARPAAETMGLDDAGRVVGLF